MARVPIFTRDDVVQAAVAVVAAQGGDALSARKVADELGASTAPVYSNFATMDELSIAVNQAVAAALLAFTQREFSADPFLNIGVGVLEFARSEPQLYSAIFMREACDCGAGRVVMSALSTRLSALPVMEPLSDGERLLLLHQLSIFTHGLAVQICTGLSAESTFADLVLLLAEAGDAMTEHALSRPTRTAAQIALIQSLLARQGKDHTGHELF